MGHLDALGLGSAPVAAWAEALSRPNGGLDGPFRIAAARVRSQKRYPTLKHDEALRSIIPPGAMRPKLQSKPGHAGWRQPWNRR